MTSGLESSVNSYYNKTNPDYRGLDKLSDGTYKSNSVMLGNANTNSMIDTYGNLVKYFESDLVNAGKARETSYPLLYKTNAHYFKMGYNVFQKNSDINWDALIATEISLEIYRDDTGNFLWWDTGNFTLMDSVTGGRIDKFNERPTNSTTQIIKEGDIYFAEFTKDPNGQNNTIESFVPQTGSYKDFFFTPSRTHLYAIETLNKSPNVDPYLKIYDSNNTRIAYDDGASNYGNDSRNSRIEITLTGGQTYRIRAMGYYYNAGYFELIIRKNAILYEANSSELKANKVTCSNDSIWYQYKPRTTGFYTFYTTGSIDTYLNLYDAKYRQYAFNDDGGSSTNAMIDSYLIAGQTYYIKARRYNIGSGIFDLFVNRQENIHIHELNQHARYNYSFLENEAVFYRFIPNASRNYIFTTSKYSGDPQIYLYDSNMNYITYDDDGNGSLNAKLTYYMQTGETYYLKIRGFSNGSSNGNLYVNY